VCWLSIKCSRGLSTKCFLTRLTSVALVFICGTQYWFCCFGSLVLIMLYSILVLLHCFWSIHSVVFNTRSVALFLEYSFCCIQYSFCCVGSLVLILLYSILVLLFWFSSTHYVVLDTRSVELFLEYSFCCIQYSFCCVGSL